MTYLSDEQELLRQAQTGDEAAYDDLHHLLQPDIERFIRRKINDPFIVDDLVQEVFIAFYQNLTRIDPVANLRPYIFRIARNKCYDHLRKHMRHHDVSLDEDPVRMRVSFAEASRQPKPDDVAHWLLLHMEVKAAIEQLPDTQRETLILYSEEQMSYADIADVMDCSIGTVKSRLYYAKKNLRGLMNPQTLLVIDDEFDSPKRTPARDAADKPERENEREPQHEPL